MYSRPAHKTVITSVATALLVAFSTLAGNAQVLSYFQVHADGVSGVDGLNTAFGVCVSPDDQHIYTCAAGSGDHAISLFTKDALGSGITYVSSIKDGDDSGTIDGLNGARRPAIAPDGNHVYVPSTGDDAIVVFSRNSTTGALTYVESHFDGAGGISELGGAFAVAVSPDNNHVYVCSSSDDAIVVFSRNTTTGALTLVQEVVDGASGVDGLNGGHGIVVSPDGGHVYVAGSVDDEIAHFTRNSGTGALTYVGVVADGTGGVDGLNNVYGLDISPDGAHLYSASASDDAVAVFSINSGTGALTFVEVHFDDEVGGTVTYLESARDAFVGASGDYVYAVSSTDDGLMVFDRNTTTGALTLSEEHVDGGSGVSGLNAARSLAALSDETVVFAVSSTSDAIAVFENSAILPVELLDFRAELVSGNMVELSWSTASERNSEAFIIERGFDGEHFEPIFELPAAGTTSQQTDYIGFDHQPQKLNYYRLKQVDMDGSFTYSPTVAVSLDQGTPIESEPVVELFPNPATESDQIYLELAGFDNEEVLVTVQDVYGRTLYSKVLITGGFSASGVFAVDPEQNLAPGTYVITGSADNELFSKKLVVR